MLLKLCVFMPVYRNSIEVSLPSLPLPLLGLTSRHPWSLARVFLDRFHPLLILSLDRGSVLNYHHVTILPRILLQQGSPTSGTRTGTSPGLLGPGLLGELERNVLESS